MEDLKKLVRRFVDTYNAHGMDFDYAEDAEFVNPAAGHLKGRQAILEYWKQALAAFPDTHGTINRMVAEGDTVATEYTVSGTNTGELRLLTGQAVPATKKRVSVPGLDLITFKGNKMVSHHQYFDQVALLAQLGLMPERAGARA